MYIVHIASEFAPLVKVGGLGDVVHGLAKEQALMGHDVELILPKYDIIQYQNIKNLTLEMSDLWSFEDSSRYHNAVFCGIVDNIKVHLIEAHHNHYYFNRGKVYGAPDDIERFLYFCRAVSEFLHLQKRKPDIIHIHDWPTAPIAPIIKHIYKDLGFSYGSIILTIHNIEHQGKCSPANLSRIGLRGEDFRTEERLADPKDPSILNLLKGGIVYSDAFATVSPTYAKEIMTPSSGFGLDGAVRRFEDKFSGILNGIELDCWNPASDKSLFFPYPTNATYIETILRSKEANKEALFNKLEMQPTKGPLIACISRLVKQKGPKFIIHAIDYVLKQNAAFILLGSSIDHEFENDFKELTSRYKNHPHFFAKLSFDEEFSHSLYAAADAIFMPSLFEPCGLTQMIAMRYGTVPIVHKTGGLTDTVTDIDNPKIPLILRNGFTFENPDPTSVERVLKRAISCYLTEKKRWRQLVQTGLAIDFSWKKSALSYESVYLETLKKKPDFKVA
ncbi:MAG: glycogen synthase [Chlamydiae bacterium]|nr:glycogen synthase [Chlamydiota bacterium]